MSTTMDKVDLAQALGTAISLADELRGTLRKSHDALWTGDAKTAYKLASQSRRLTSRIIELMKPFAAD